jgi:chromosome segregation protein
MTTILAKAHVAHARIAADEEIDRLNAEIEQYKHKQGPLTQRITVLQAKVAGVDAANMLAARGDEFRLASEQLEQLKAQALQASDEVIAANQNFDTAQEAKSRFDSRLTELNFKIQQLQNETLRLKAGNDAHKREQVQRLEALRTRRKALPDTIHSSRAELKKLKGEFESVGMLRREMARLDERLEREDWETDENVLVLRDKLREELRQMESQTVSRQREFDRVMELCDEARGAYITVLRNTVRRYGKNIRALGELAGIEVHVESPHLENDDTVLAQAGLTVQFNFDRKGMMGLNDGEASGGQQVMKSLILLIGLMMDEARPWRLRVHRRTVCPPRRVQHRQGIQLSQEHPGAVSDHQPDHPQRQRVRAIRADPGDAQETAGRRLGTADHGCSAGKSRVGGVIFTALQKIRKNLEPIKN